MTFEEFKAKFEKVPVDTFPNQVPDNPFVSICVQTYQHVNYIRECLDGILMQQTDFLFEILLGEDQSTDGTREICIEYAARYPEKIRLFLHHRENNIRIGGRATGRFNFLYNLYSSKGKYVAVCEGDDYWIDALKLQKQVNFMEANTSYGLVYTNFSKEYIKEQITITNMIKSTIEGDIYRQLLCKNSIPTCTILYRASIFKSYIKELYPVCFNWIIGDYPIWIYIALNKKIKYLADNTSTYRKLESSLTSTTHRNKLLFHLAIFKVRIFFLLHKRFYLYPFIKSLLMVSRELFFGIPKMILNYDSKPPELKNLNRQ